jgi:hypothetical protein
MHFVGVRGLTSSSYILCDYTSTGYKGTIENICNMYIYTVYTVHIHFYTLYLFICDALKV